MLTPVVSPEVRTALADGRGVVALESTIFSNLGLPHPANGQALQRCIAAIEQLGAVAAVTAVLDGVPRVGIGSVEHERILGSATKVAERDLAVAVATGCEFGATTVSATVALCEAAGISVFATGGIGGVHRGAETTGDISADLDALANHPVITVSAGAKAFLDLGRTLEYLETVGVPVLGWRTSEFPAFYSRSSGLSVPHTVPNASTVATIFANRARSKTGALVAVPIPESDAIDREQLEAVIHDALAAASAEGVGGSRLTPYVLESIAAGTHGRTVPANLALAEQNASVAAEIANEVAARGGSVGDDA